jgi:hypothetical protein
LEPLAKGIRAVILVSEGTAPIPPGNPSNSVPEPLNPKSETRNPNPRKPAAGTPSSSKSFWTQRGIRTCRTARGSSRWPRSRLSSRPLAPPRRRKVTYIRADERLSIICTANQPPWERSHTGEPPPAVVLRGWSWFALLDTRGGQNTRDSKGFFPLAKGRVCLHVRWLRRGDARCHARAYIYTSSTYMYKPHSYW